MSDLTDRPIAWTKEKEETIGVRSYCPCRLGEGPLYQTAPWIEMVNTSNSNDSVISSFYKLSSQVRGVSRVLRVLDFPLYL